MDSGTSSSQYSDKSPGADIGTAAVAPGGADGGPERKRKRRSGWDVDAPPSGGSSGVVTAASVVAPAPPSVTVVPPVPAAPIVIPGVGAVAAYPVPLPQAVLPVTASSSSLDPTVAQQLALHKAQQIIAQQAQTRNLPVGPQATADILKRYENRIYVGSLSYTITDAEVRAVFSSFGPIRSIDMSHDPATNRSKGYCFVDYENPAHAQAAIAMNGVEIAGRPMKVGRPQHHGIPTSVLAAVVPNAGAAWAPPPVLAPAYPATMSTSSVPPVVVPPAAAAGAVPPPPTMSPGAAAALLSASVPVTAAVSTSGINSTTIAAPAPVPALSSTAKVVVLDDMVPLAEASDPGLKQEIEEETANFGTLEDISIEVVNNSFVRIKLFYARPEDALKAYKALNGRYFGGKPVRASLQ